MHLVVVVGELFGDDRLDDVLDQIGPDHRVAVDAVVVLGGDEHGLEPNRLAVLVVEGDLGLAVGAEVRDGPGLADLGEALGHAVGDVDRHRHEDVGLVAGVAEHHALIAGTLLVVARPLRRRHPLRTSSDSSTPWAMSGDCSSIDTMTPQVLPSKPKLSVS